MNKEDLIKLDIEECAGQYCAYLDDIRISKAKPVGVMHNIHSINCRKDYIKEVLGIPKGAVVLSKEEYKNDFCNQFNKGYKIARKETAKEIFEKLYTWLCLEEISKYGFVTIQKFDFLRKFREIIKQYGVKVEE